MHFSLLSSHFLKTANHSVHLDLAATDIARSGEGVGSDHCPFTAVGRSLLKLSRHLCKVTYSGVDKQLMLLISEYC